jgi:hypothetical protein
MLCGLSGSGGPIIRKPVNSQTHFDHHRSPSHHIEGGSLDEIFVARSATRWLRLYA